MPIKSTERRGREYGPKRGRQIWGVTGTLDETEAINAILGGDPPLAPMTWGELSRIDYGTREVGYKAWEFDIEYGNSALEPLAGVTNWSYSTDGGTVLQKFLEENVPGFLYWDESKYPDAPVLGRAIGVNSDLSIEGVERIVGRQSAEARTRLTTGEVTSAYLAQVLALTGTICDADFGIWAEGEALFAGARIQQVNALEWDASFLFFGSPNRTDLKVGSVENIQKEGWQYLWTYVRPGVETLTTEGTIASPEARAIYVDNIYKKSDFNLLGIPT